MFETTDLKHFNLLYTQYYKYGHRLKFRENKRDHT